MKRIFNIKTVKVSLRLLIVCLSLLMLTSCSSLFSRRKNVDSNSITREQYDELLKKYQELLAESKKINGEEKKEQVRPGPAVLTVIDPSELVNKIDTSLPTPKVAEGVDVIGSTPLTPHNEEVEKKAGPPVPEVLGVQHVNVTDDVDDQISKLRDVQMLVKTNKFENALAILKDLENSKEKQIVVRSKMMLGDLLFQQGEFDLAMQVYEEIIKKYAFSGYVVKALGKLVTCSEKLKLPEKQAKYYSLLHDFFEAS